MPNETGAVFLGLFLSIANFVIFIVFSALTVRRKTTTAFAAMAAGFIVRLTIVTAAYVYFVTSAKWGPLIYWISAGFLPSVTVLLVIEIALLIWMEKRLKNDIKPQTKERDTE